MPDAKTYARMSPEKRAELVAKKRAWRAANREKVHAQDARSWAKLRADPEAVAEYNRKQRERLNARYADDPAFKAKHAARQERYRGSEKGKATMLRTTDEYRKAHPEFYTKQAAKSALAEAMSLPRAAVPAELIEAKAAEYLVRKAVREARRK